MPTAAAALRVRRNGAPVAHFVDTFGNAYTLAYTPQEFTRGGITPRFEQVPIAGRKPSLVQDALQLKTLQFTHTLARPDGAAIDDQLRRIETLAASGGRVRLIAWDAGGARGWWNITDFQISGKFLTADQHIQSADLTWQLTEANDPRPKIGRVRTKALNIAAPGSTAVSTYTLKSGDNLYSVAQQVMGDGERWREIVEINPGLFPYGYGRGAGSANAAENATASLVGKTVRVPGRAEPAAGIGGRAQIPQ